MTNGRITIAQPCAESWDAMQPTADGKYCGACQKEVIDFAQKTDAEILAILAEMNSPRFCGRFAARQLNRSLEVPAEPPRWRAWLATALALWGAREVVGLESVAQANARQTIRASEGRVDERNLVVADSGNSFVKGGFLIEGVVMVSMDSIRTDSTQEAMPGATVLLAGTTHGTMTDATGKFSLTIADGQWPVRQLLLVVSATGYLTEKVIVSDAKPASNLGEIVLRQDPAFTLDNAVIVGGACIARPWPWHSRRFYRWVTKPFRR